MDETQGVVRVVIADDHPTTRMGVRVALDGESDIEVVGEAEDGAEAMQLVADLRPDVLLLDLVMPGLRPSEIEEWVRSNCPETTTLVLTAHDRDCYLAGAIRAGVAGFLMKNEEAERLRDAIRRAAAGQVVITVSQLARAHRWREDAGERWESLTGREQEVLRLLAAGQITREIAEGLEISERTVRTHIGNVLGKLGVLSRAAAVAWAWKHGVVER
jgi:NarL family two-component system response regulator LiaR